MTDEILLTKQGYDKIVSEHEELVSVKRKEVSERIKEAISYGDISENSEYDSAKNEQAELEERIHKLENMMRKAKIIDESKMSNDRVSIGLKVRVKLNEQRLIRREKLKKLQEMGRNPFLMEEWNVDAHSVNIKNNYDAFEGKTVTCAGRIMANRHMGKASFIDIQDKMGRIQCYIRQDVITPEEYQVFVTYDIGDIVGVVGNVFTTKHGEVSIKVSQITLLTKSLQVLPNKFQGLKDQDN